jgi:hypothetical protein
MSFARLDEIYGSWEADCVYVHFCEVERCVYE